MASARAKSCWPQPVRARSFPTPSADICPTAHRGAPLPIPLGAEGPGLGIARVSWPGLGIHLPCWLAGWHGFAWLRVRGGIWPFALCSPVR